MKVETERMPSIGRFARLSGLTVKALRRYDEIGLLHPAHVDSWTGYRWYEPAQVRDAIAVRRLPALRIPLEEVGVLIRSDESSRREALAVHRARLEGEFVETRQILAELDRLIDGKERLVTELTFDLRVVDEPAGRYAVTGDRVRVDDMTTHVPEAIMRVRRLLEEQGVACIDQPLTIFLGNGIDEWLDVEVGWPIADAELDVADGMVVRELAAARAAEHVHRGSYDELPALYGALEAAIRGQGLEPQDLAREHYVVNPGIASNPAGFVTRIVGRSGPETGRARRAAAPAAARFAQNPCVPAARTLVAAALLGLALAGCSGGGRKVTVPSTEFKTLPAALAALRSAGLRASIPYFPPLPASAGGPNANDLSTYRVAWQTPSAGSTAKRGSAVSLALSVARPLGIGSIAEPVHTTPTVVVPDLVGKTYEQALATGDPWRGYWVEVGKAAPIASADGLGSIRVVAQSPAPGTRVPFGGIKPGVRGVQPSLSTVTVTLGGRGQTPAGASDAINRATARAASLLRIGSEFQIFRLGSLFPVSASTGWCRIQRGTSVTRGVPGTCWTAVEPDAVGGGSVVYRELWDGRDYRPNGVAARPDLEHTWHVRIDGTGAVREIVESGVEEPQKAPGTPPTPGRMESRWLDQVTGSTTPRRAHGRAAAELEARLRAAVEASGATPVQVRVVPTLGRAPAAAVTLRTADPPVYLRDRLRPVVRGLSFKGRPAYLLVLDQSGRRILEWYETGNGGALYVVPELRDCSPLEAVGWEDLAGCPA